MEPTRLEQYARLIAVTLLMLGCVLVLLPFMGAILFAGVLVLSTWPAFAWLRARWGGRGTLAALAIVLGMVIALVVPIALVAQSLVLNSASLVDDVRGFLDRRSAITMPEFVGRIPLVGAWLSDYGRSLLESRDELIALVKRLADPARVMLAALGAAVGQGLIQVLVALFVAFFFYRDGERVRVLLLELLGRLAGHEHGELLARTGQSAVKGVVYGLLGTALAQAAVAFVGFLIAGVPGAVLLGAGTFLLSLVPMGPVLIWGGAAVWLYAQGSTGWAIFMVIYGAAVISSVDNFIKPILMSRAGNLSMLLVVLGVFGGAIAFGFIGLFVGPALLAVGWSVIVTWLDLQRVEGEA
ncbi:MAG TPA: AI-2E family transporter [Usitatibacter sp.]|jgi:predicted PurR-regulated permease PerM|nr:AI-2E family transporter [Usitatibacter sp.]